MRRSRGGPGRARFRAVVLGVSSGGVAALKQLLPALPANFSLPLLVVTHLGPEAGDGLARLLDELAALCVKEADEGELARAGVVYLAPANYHLLIESDGRLALSAEAAVNFARPSIDVLFESAAASLGAAVIGVILTGAADDGARGLARIKERGGYTIVQDPADAAVDSMPRSALALRRADQVVSLQQLSPLLLQLAGLTRPVAPA